MDLIRRRFIEGVGVTMKWNAEKAISRIPNRHEHIGLSAPDSLARIRALVDEAEKLRCSGYLVEHVKELAICLTFWPSASQVAEAA